MSNFNANANLAIDSQEDLLAKMKAINDSLIHNHSIQVEGDKEDDDTDYKDIAVTDEDAILTEPYSIVYFKEQSELQNAVFGILNQIFADIFSVRLTMDLSRGGFVFVCSFKYMTEQQFKEKLSNSETNLVRCITSTVDPEEIVSKNSIATNLINMVQLQNMNAYDATKYAKITKSAKELLTKLLYFSQDNPKHKWVNGNNYIITTQTGTSSWGNVTFTNIIADIYLDAKAVVAMLAGKEKKNKYEYNIVPAAFNATGSNSVIKIEQINVANKRHISSQLGAVFQQ